jgi:hypothetical protein
VRSNEAGDFTLKLAIFWSITHKSAVRHRFENVQLGLY